MADTLEHREGISHVAFNFLVLEVCQALEEGLKAEQEEITRRWGQMHSRTYVTKMLRSLGNSGVFQRGWHTGKDKDTGRTRRRSTFNLNRDHDVVRQVLEAQWQTSDSGDSSFVDPLPDEVDSQVMQPSESGNGDLPAEHTEEAGADNSFGIGKVMRLFSRS